MEKKRAWQLLPGLWIGLGLILAACGPVAGTETVSPVSRPSPTSQPPAPTGRPTPTAEATMDPGRTEGSQPDPQAAALLEEAKKDLGQRLNVAVDHIHPQSVEAVQWRDSSLGCPKPGMSYLMVITPGYRIRLEAQGRVYEYHTSMQQIVCCEKPKPPPF